MFIYVLLWFAILQADAVIRSRLFRCSGCFLNQHAKPFAKANLQKINFLKIGFFFLVNYPQLKPR